MTTDHWPALLLIIGGMAGSVWWQKLTPAGSITGGLFGLIIFCSTGYTGLTLMALFFVLGTAATAWHKKEKIRLGIAEERESRRTAAQVVANAGVGALVALAALLHPAQEAMYHIMLAAAFSAATADTLASELGNVYGSRYFNILTLKKDRRGLDGVISWEGTVAGVFGSLVIAVVFVLGSGWQSDIFGIIVLAGTIGNLADSVMGALWERKGRLGNNAVNFLNTATAAAVAALLYWL